MRDLILRFASRLRFPVLFFITAAFFVIDLIVPDLIPLADELLLGLMTLLFGSWRKQRGERKRPPASRQGNGSGADDDDDVIDITVEKS